MRFSQRIIYLYDFILFYFRDKKKIENVLDWQMVVKKYYAVVKNAPKL